MNWGALVRRLDEPRDLKRAVYRVHRLVGITLFAGGLFALDQLWFTYGRVLARVVDGWGRADLHAVLIESLWLFLIGGNAVALPAALVVVFRPSILKGVERWTDRFYD